MSIKVCLPSYIFCVYNCGYTDNLPLEICEDIKDECVKYGEVLELKIPRPTGGSRQSNGIGKIYIKYDTADTAAKAMQALAGRKFADRTVVVAPFEEELFDVNAW